MKNYTLTNPEDIEIRELEKSRIRVIFSKVFDTNDGRQAINMLRRKLYFIPKTDMEYAKLVGIHSVIDSIFDFMGILESWKDDDGR